MARVASSIGLAIFIALVMLAGITLTPQSLSPFDKYAYNKASTPVDQPVEQKKPAEPLNGGEESAPEAVEPEEEPAMVLKADNFDKQMADFKAKKKKEEQERLAKQKKKQEEAEKKRKEEEEKKKKEGEKKKQEEEDKKKKAEEEKNKAKEDEEKSRIATLANNESGFQELKQKVDNLTKELDPLKKDLDAAVKFKEEEKKKSEEEKKESEKKAAKELSDKLGGQFHKLESQEIRDIVEKPLVYQDEEKTDNGHVAPYGKKIVVLSASNNSTTSEQFMLARALPNRQEYCNMHSYTCKFINLDDVHDRKSHIVWAKIKAIEKAFADEPEAEWIWWMDTDIVIVNPYLELGEHLLSDRALVERLTYDRPIRAPDASFKGEVYPSKGQVEAKDIHLLLTQDFFGINAGSFFLRRSDFSKFLLDLWYDQHFIDKNYVFREQQALNLLLRSHSTVLQHTGLYPQRLFNGYLGRDNDVWKYKENDLVVHFAGCGTSNTCHDKFATHFKLRKRVPTEFQVPHPADD